MADFSKHNTVTLPGFVDVHVHFREPGFSYKETMKTGLDAAEAGGYCAVCTMPNVDPVPDCPENLKNQAVLIDAAEESIRAERGRSLRIFPYASITAGEKGEKLSEMEKLAPFVIAFSDDGRGVQSALMMKEAMLKAKSLGKLIAAHCEDDSISRGGVIHDGRYAREHGLKGIPSESEWAPIARDLELAAQTGCRYHICHVSCAESVELIRQAKKSGIDVTCETAPHYLLLTEDDLKDEGRFKMNPPVRTADDRDALIEGVFDGTVDMIATDHAPHSESEKSKGLAGSAFGITGLETAFPLLYTKLVLTRKITLEKLTELMSLNPAKRFGITLSEKDLRQWDLSEEYTVDPRNFRSKGRATPFSGERVYGKLLPSPGAGQCGGAGGGQTAQYDQRNDQRYDQ